MDNTNAFRRLLLFVLSKYTQVEVTKIKRRRKLIRGTLNAPPGRIADLLTFLMNNGQTADEAVNVIHECEKKSVEIAVENSKSKVSYVLWFIMIIFFVAVVPRTFSGGYPTWLYLLYAPLFVGFALLMLSPRQRTLDKIWKQNDMLAKDNIGDDLPALLDVCKQSYFQVLFSRYLFAAIALFTAGTLFFGAVAYSLISDYSGYIAYNKTMTSSVNLLAEKDSEGTRFTVYDENEKVFLQDYLSDELRAETPEDVAGVLMISLSDLEVGTYGLNGSDGTAYQYYMVIRLYDCKSGEFAGNTVVYGANPPVSIRVSSSERSRKVHGAKPTDETIAQACEKLIRTYQNNG